MEAPSNSWVHRRSDLKSWLTTKYSWSRLMPLILVTKDNWFASILTCTVGLLMGRERFRTRFATTIGPVVLLPKEYTYQQAKRVCVHEVRGHIFQFWACGGFLPFVGPWLGIVFMGVLYGLLFPVYFNWFRYRLELHADTQVWKCMIEEGQVQKVLPRARAFALTVSSWAYGKPVPERWAQWGFFRRALRLTRAYQRTVPR